MTQGPPTQEGQWRMKPLRKGHLSRPPPDSVLPVPSVCVGRSAPNSGQEWGGRCLKLLETEQNYLKDIKSDNYLGHNIWFYMSWGSVKSNHKTFSVRV